LIAAINEGRFLVRIDVLDCLESISRQWERLYTSLRKKGVAYVLIVEMGIQALISSLAICEVSFFILRPVGGNKAL